MSEERKGELVSNWYSWNFDVTSTGHGVELRVTEGEGEDRQSIDLEMPPVVAIRISRLLKAAASLETERSRARD